VRDDSRDDREKIRSEKIRLERREMTAEMSDPRLSPI
jgi:hypothetical protein